MGIQTRVAIITIGLLLLSIDNFGLETLTPRPTTEITARGTFQLEQVPVNALQATTPANSNGTMDRANLQRSGVYNTKGMTLPTEDVWASPKIFKMERYRNHSWGDWYEFSGRSVFLGGSYSTPNGQSYSNPLFANGAIYFTLDDEYKVESTLYAVDAQTGQIRWTIKRVLGKFSMPAFAGDTLYIGSDKGLFYALDPVNKKVRWTSSSGDGSWVVTSALVADGTVFFGSNNGIFYALDAQTGQAKWTYETQRSGFSSAPAISGDAIYFSTYSNYLHSLNIKTGKENWKIQTKDGANSIVATDDTIYFTDGKGYIQAVEAETGQQLPISKKRQRASTPLAFTDQTIYFSGWKWGNIYAVDARTMQQKWRFDTEGACSPPVIAEGIVYCTCDDNRLYAVDSRTGLKRWATKPYKATLSAPIIADGKIYFISDDGRLYAMR